MPQHTANRPIPAAPKETPPSQPKTALPEAMAMRKGCTADGVGLSHYILMDTSRK